MSAKTAPAPMAPREAAALYRFVRDLIRAAAPVAARHPLGFIGGQPPMIDVRLWRGFVPDDDAPSAADRVAAARPPEILTLGPMARGLRGAMGFAQNRTRAPLIALRTDWIDDGIGCVIAHGGWDEPDYVRTDREAFADPPLVTGRDHLARNVLHELAHVAAGDLRHRGDPHEHGGAWRVICGELYRHFGLTAPRCFDRARKARDRGAPVYTGA